MNSQSVTSGKCEKRLNASDYPVLAVLSLAPAHGYDVWRHLQDNLGSVWKLGRSNIYAVLAQLERDGLVKHDRVEQKNLPARKVFCLTNEGLRMIEEWLRSPVEHVREFRLEFPVKLYFARKHSSASGGQLVRDQLLVCAQKRAEALDTLAQCTSEIERHVFAYRIGLIEATMTWLEGLVPAK